MIQPETLLRIAVIGTSCAGKTTFARRLSERTGSPHIHLDALYWGPQWTPRPADEFESAIAQAVAHERWICDGNYSPVRELVWSRATAVVWLDLPLAVLFGRSLWRTFRRCVDGEPVCGGNRESLRNALSWDSIPMWVLRTYRRRRRDYPRLLAEPRYRHLRVFRPRTSWQADQLLGAVAAAEAARHAGQTAGN